MLEWRGEVGGEGRDLRSLSISVSSRVSCRGGVLRPSGPYSPRSCELR